MYAPPQARDATASYRRWAGVLTWTAVVVAALMAVALVVSIVFLVWADQDTRNAACGYLALVLWVGIAAGVPVYGAKAKKDNLEVSVERVVAGTSDDLSVLKDAAQYQGRTPYYVHYRVTKTDADDVSGPSFDVTADGDLLTRLNIMSAFPQPIVGADGKLSY
ncbi:hypothetical protein [Streptomyces xanthophaeus]